jgi:hypothetical protein
MTRRLSISLTLAAAAVAAALMLPGAGNAASRTQTLRFFDKPVSITLTHTDGTVESRPTAPPMPGDVLDVYSLDFPGTHRHHAKRWTGSSHVRCVFGSGESHVAIGGSMLIFKGNPGTVTAGTGIYRNATGRVVSAKEVGNDATDVVARIRLHR